MDEEFPLAIDCVFLSVHGCLLSFGWSILIYSEVIERWLMPWGLGIVVSMCFILERKPFFSF